MRVTGAPVWRDNSHMDDLVPRPPDMEAAAARRDPIDFMRLAIEQLAQQRAQTLEKFALDMMLKGQFFSAGWRMALVDEKVVFHGGSLSWGTNIVAVPPGATPSDVGVTGPATLWGYDNGTPEPQ